MAEISSNDIGLYYSVDGSTNWLLIACSTSDGFSGSTDSITISNKCESGFTKNLPGDRSWSFSNSSYAQKTPEAGQMSIDDVFDLWAAGTVGYFKLESINADEYYRYGQGFISDISDTMDAGDYLTFDLTITGNGAVTNVETT